MVPDEEVGGTDSTPGLGMVNGELFREASKTEDVIASITIATIRVKKKNEIKWKECCATLPFVNFIMAHSFRLLNL